jgi:bifunctional non-homologous end joining protein LigD
VSVTRARSLDRYHAKRDFSITAEPKGEVRGRSPRGGRSFVVQKHDARRLHYDLRLEHDGVLLSWAVPKGPSLDPKDKRLAVQTEDHPLDYRDFEGTIPEKQYGAGPVIVWDRGTWTPIGDPDEGLQRGRLEFELDGDKLHGRFLLVRTSRSDKPTWLLMKRNDEWARTGAEAAIVNTRPESVLTGRTIEDVAAGVPAAPPSVAHRKARPRAEARAQAAESIRPAELPPFGSIAPALATLVDAVPASGPWIYEIKYDGYRVMSWLEDGKVRLASRRGLDWTESFPTIAAALSRVRARTAIFDGEVAYVREDGRTDFQKLQNALFGASAADQARLVYFVFDLLFYDGVDLRNEPLSYRKDRLRTILAGEDLPLKLSDHVEDGATFLREACKLGLEGIVGKRADRPYRSGRSKDWIKIKCHQYQELVIVGYTPMKGHRSCIGALLVGLPEGGRLRYAGRVGTGFSNATLRDLKARLDPLVVDEPPVADPPRLKDVRWVRPELVAQVRFSEWTSDGLLRQPSFEGLRLDKPAREVRRELPQPPPKAVPGDPPETDTAAHVRAARARATAKPRVRGVGVTHHERVVDAGTGLTKLDLVRYAGEVADAMFPYAERRPLMLLRCPEGTEISVFRQSDRRRAREGQGKRSSCFVQKHHGQGLDATTLGQALAGDEEVLFIAKPEHAVTLAQNNTIEIHGWGSRLPRWDRPDWIVFDLDPDESLPFRRVVDAALELRDALKTLGLDSWVKTTGGKGLHVVVPIALRYDWPTIRAASERIAVLMEHAAPDRYVVNMSRRVRAGKVYIDFLRNAEGQTAVLPWSPRARPGLPVAVPIAWRDLPAIDPAEFTIVTAPKLLARRRSDPWAALLEARQTLPRELLAAIAH